MQRPLLIIASCFLFACNQTEIKDPFKKMKPAEAEAWKWSYPDSVWSETQASHALDAVARWKDRFETGTDRFTGGEWRLEGPTNIGGRFNFIKQHPTEPDHFFAGSSSGGLWEDNGDGNWTCITENLPALAMGDLVFYPDNPDRMFLATGDPQISSFPRIGDGVYRTLDGGATWQNMGLDSMGVISKLTFLPTEPPVLLAGAMGNPAIPGPNRGIFRSSNAGMDWEQVLLPNDSAGVTDILYDPFSGNVFAAAWQRTRNSTNSEVWGPHCGIWRSADEGISWELLENPWGSEDRGRIGLAFSNEGVYALVVGQDHQLDNIYRTSDGGDSWGAIIPEGNQPENALGGFGWYFSKLRINPFNPDDLTILGVNLWNSQNGGGTWNIMGPEWWTYEVHADKHDMQWLGSSSFVLATDGGLYRTEDHGLTWEDIESIPVTQFYRTTWNPHNPGMYTGGAQDNGTTTGSWIDPENWSRDLGGDGFTAIYHPTDASLRYAGTQWGNWRFSMTSPSEEPLWNDFTIGIDEEDRVWWDAPLIYHPSNPDQMWTGTQRLYRMNDAPVSVWQPKSPDLTANTSPGLSYRCISSIAGSYFNENYIAAGTTDGLMWISLDGGNTWDPMGENLPGQFVTDVEFDPFHPDSMFCTVSGYRNAIYQPYVFRAAIGGEWNSIQGDLPPHPVNQIVALNDSIWCVATDAGVFQTQNRGTNWTPVGSLPIIPVYDIVADTLENRLVAGTFARSILSFPLDSILPAGEIVEPNGLAEAESIPIMKVFPNPVQNQVTLMTSKPASRVMVFDISGSMILMHDKTGRQFNFDTQDWNAGMYIMTVEFSDGSFLNERLIKR